MFIESNNLIFDDTNPQCQVTVKHHDGQLQAFVIALDLGAEHSRFETPIEKRYFRPFNWQIPEASIKHVIEWGREWTKLP